MKNIIKIFTLLVALLIVTNSADARLRGGSDRVAAGTVKGGTLRFFTDEKCETEIDDKVAAGSTVFIKAKADWGKRLGTADANGKVSFITAEQTVNSTVAQTRGEIGLGESIDVVFVKSKLDEGIYKFVMPTDAKVNVKVSAQFADPDPNLNVQITSVAANYNVDENAAEGTIVGKLTVTDKTKVDGAYESLNYTLTSDFDADVLNDIFEVNEVNNFAGVRTIEISAKNQEKLDFEYIKSFIAKLYVENTSGDYAAARFNININNLNEDFTLDNQTFTLAEKQENGKDWPAGTVFGNVKVTASDKNTSDYIFKVTTSGIPFNFYQGTNDLIITDGSALDYETKPTWTFKISVSDGEYTHDATITINLTDVNEAPQISDCKKEYTIKENSKNGTKLGSITVKDYDKVEGQYEQFTYTLSLLNDALEVKESANNAGDRIVSIVVKDESKLDYEKLYNETEENAIIPITITATDTQGNSASVKTKIVIEDVNEKLTARGGTFYLNEHSPIGSNLSSIEYKDDAKKVVAKVEAEDEDKYNPDFSKLSYTISKNNTSSGAADAKKFNIDPRTGRITSAEEFDYEKETMHKYSFLVNVSDGYFSADVEVTVNIQDITEPTFKYDDDVDVYVKENTETGEKIADFKEILDKIKAKEEDIRDKLAMIIDNPSFTIDQEASVSAKGLFEIDDQGFIKVKNSLDFENLYPNNKFTVVVKVNGQSSNHNDIILTINVKIEVTDVNEAPTAEDVTISIPETQTYANGSIGNIKATDPDFMSIVSVRATPNGKHPLGFNKLYYSLNEVLEVNGSTDFPFEINENTGAITVREGETLNFSKQNQYQFVVKVTDCAIDENNPKQSDIAKVTINITDINNAPKFITVSDVYDVDENEDEGTVVNGDKILVYDDDQDDVDKLTITIRDNYATAALDAAKLFEVVQDGRTNSQTHESTFVIKTKSGLDYEALYKSIDKDAIFDVTLTIKDSEERTKYPQKNCKIRVNDVNEEPSENKNSFSFSVDENTTTSPTLGKVEVLDPDMYKAEYGTLYYSLIDNDATQFTIDAEGNLSTIHGTQLDYETKDKYEFRVEVTDKTYSIKVPVTVTINNVNEAPAFAEGTQVLLVDEYAEIGSKVGIVSANDDDMKNGKTGKRPTYSLEATDNVADDYKAFEIDKSSGVIKVKAHPIESFNTKHEYNVRVVATDGDDPSLTDYVDVVIKTRLKMENLFSTGNAFTSYVAPDNMAVPEGLSAYVVTDIDGASAAIQQIDYLPQSVPVLIKRADNDVNLFMATTGNGTSFYVNKLQINETDREVSVGELYLLYRDEFVLTSSGTLPAGSVYLPINDVVAKTRSLTIGDGEDGTTGIDDITPALSEGEETWYDLQGRRQGSKPTRRGIYISNGRKVVIK